MEITATRSYKITIDEAHYSRLNENGTLTDLINTITYASDGGDVVGTMHLIHCYNKENPLASPYTTWSLDPQDHASEYVAVAYIDQVDFEVEDMGLNNQDA